jgi:Transposase DDE domain group 1
MSDSPSVQLRFPSMPGFTIRGEFDGGEMSSDLGPILLRGIDQQIGLTQRLADAFNDKRHLSYVDHSMRDLFAQRIFQVSSGYEDANDSNSLRTDPMFKIGLNRAPLDSKSALASASTFSRLENAATQKDVYRIGVAFVKNFVDSYAKPPKIIVLDMDHSEDQAHGQQQFAIFNGYYKSNCYLPLFIFEGLSGKFITAVLRSGERPSGEENAMIIKRVMKIIRTAWPDTRIVLRGDGHFSNPELMELVINDSNADFAFGVGTNITLSSFAAPLVKEAKRIHDIRVNNSKSAKISLPSNTILYGETEYAAKVTVHSPPLLSDQEYNQIRGGGRCSSYAAAITGKGGTVSPLLRLAITSARNGHGKTFRLRHVSITLANRATTRLP